jgi:hypothetical protein
MNRLGAILVILGLAAGVRFIDSPPVAAQAGPPRVLAFLESLKGTEEEALRWPVAVAAASAEEVAVADAFGARLLRFRRVGVSWQLDGTVEMGGVPVALTSDGRRYVASLREGKGLASFEGPALQRRTLPLPPGVVPGALSTYSDGDLLVYDVAGGRALRLSGSGRPTTEVKIEGQVTALATSAAGGFFAAVAAEGSVLHFGANGSLAQRWELPGDEHIPAWPVGLAAEPGGDLYVVDRHGARLLVLDANGELVGLGSRRGWEPGLLHFPAGIARLPNGLVLVADEGNGRAQVFRRVE